MCKQVPAPLPCTYTSLAHTGTAAAHGTHTQQTPCAASLSGLQLLQEELFHRAAGSSCACTGQVTTVSVEGAGKWSGHPSGPSWLGKLRPAAMSSVPHLFLLHPSIQLHSRGVVMVLGVLFATSPRPLSPPHSLGVLHSTEAHGDRQWQTRSLQPPAPNHLLQSSAFLPRVGRAFPVLQHGVTRCQPMAQGSPCRAPSCLLPHGAPGVNAHPSIPHPLAPRTRPPLGPPVSPNPALDPPRRAQLRGRTEKRAQGVHVVAEGGKPV